MKTILLVAAMALAVPGTAFASGKGGGGGGTKPPLPTPAIAPGTFEGIGPGPLYVRESFGRGQRTRYDEGGAMIDAVDKPQINGIRAEFPNNRAEIWTSSRTTFQTASWKLSVTSPGARGSRSHRCRRATSASRTARSRSSAPSPAAPTPAPPRCCRSPRPAARRCPRRRSHSSAGPRSASPPPRRPPRTSRPATPSGSRSTSSASPRWAATPASPRHRGRSGSPRWWRLGCLECEAGVELVAVPGDELGEGAVVLGERLAGGLARLAARDQRVGLELALEQQAPHARLADPGREIADEQALGQRGHEADRLDRGDVGARLEAVGDGVRAALGVGRLVVAGGPVADLGDGALGVLEGVGAGPPAEAATARGRSRSCRSRRARRACSYASTDPPRHEAVTQTAVTRGPGGVSGPTRGPGT